MYLQPAQATYELVQDWYKRVLVRARTDMLVTYKHVHKLVQRLGWLYELVQLYELVRASLVG